jgi:hypothetical protein
MLQGITSQIIFTPSHVHALDTVTKEVKSVEVSSKTMIDKNYAGTGERETVVSSIKNIQIWGVGSSPIAAIANKRVANDDSDVFLPRFNLIKFNATTIKGVM